MVHFMFLCMAIAGLLIVITAIFRCYKKHLSLRICNVMTIIGELLALPWAIQNVVDERNTPNTLILVGILLIIFINVILFVTQETTKKK